MAQTSKKQIAFVAVALAVSAAALVYHFLNRDPLGSRPNVFLIDVETGEVFVANPRKRGLTIPAVRPSDKATRALVRLDKDENGEYHVSEYDLAALNAIDKSVKITAFDPSSGKLVNPFSGRGASTYPIP